MLKHLWVRLMAVLAVCLWTVTAFAADTGDDLQGLIQGAIALAKDGKWWALAATIIFVAIRTTRPDVTWMLNVPARWRPVLALALGVVGSVAQKVMSGGDIKTSLQWGLSAAVAAMLSHTFVVNVARNGRELGEPKPAGGSGGGGGPGTLTVTDAGTLKSEQPAPYGAPPGTRLLAVGLALAALTVVPGCASIPKILTVIADVTSIVQEAQSLAASARDEESSYFLQHPNAEAQAKVERALSDVEQSLAAFSRAAKGVTESSLGQLDAAQADFVLAWKKLEGVLRDLGVMHGNKIAASPGVPPTEIREPLLLTAKLHS